MIILNVFSVIVESFVEIRDKYFLIFKYFENFSVCVFSIEYLLRLITADLRFKTSFKRGVVKYVFSWMVIIDLLAILPSIAPMLLKVDLRFIRIVRLLRVSRIFKLNRYSNSIKLIGEVFREKRSDLAATIFITFILLIVSSTLMYHVEKNVQPDAFPNIAASFWWAGATLTTVGYGDVYPITLFVKIIAGVIAL